VEMVPGPEVYQVTAVLVLPVTVAVNCWVAPTMTLGVAGETEMPTVGGGGGVLLCPPPPQPENGRSSPSEKTARKCFRMVPPPVLGSAGRRRDGKEACGGSTVTHGMMPGSMMNSPSSTTEEVKSLVY
jgi:hypothetical protein